MISAFLFPLSDFGMLADIGIGLIIGGILFVAATAYSVVASQAARKAAKRAAQGQIGLLVQTRAAAQPRRIIYGKRRVGAGGGDQAAVVGEGIGGGGRLHDVPPEIIPAGVGGSLPHQPRPGVDGLMPDSSVRPGRGTVKERCGTIAGQPVRWMCQIAPLHPWSRNDQGCSKTITEQARSKDSNDQEQMGAWSTWQPPTKNRKVAPPCARSSCCGDPETAN